MIFRRFLYGSSDPAGNCFIRTRILGNNRADGVESLEALMARALEASGVDPIDCPIDYRDSQRALFEKIPAASGGLE